MKNRIFIIITIAVLAVVTIGITSCVGGHKFNMGNKKELHDYILYKIQKELDLTDTQVEELKAICEDIKAKKEELHSNDEEKHEQLKALITSDYLSEADVIAVIDSHTPQVEEMKTFIAQKIAEVHAILTPEQRRALIKHLEEGCKNKKGFLH